MEEYICRFCGKVCKNANSHRNHERMCKSNPNRQESFFTQYNKTHNAWNKGLTKENDDRLKKQGETIRRLFDAGILVSPQKGKPHTEEEKKRISESRRKFLEEHPDQVPYLLNHHSKGQSYPERYFERVLAEEDLKIEKEYNILSYHLDFANPLTKKYLEIDGDQHYYDKRIVEHDKIRTERLIREGWVGYRVRWSQFQKLTPEEKSKEISFIKDFLRNSSIG